MTNCRLYSQHSFSINDVFEILFGFTEETIHSNSKLKKIMQHDVRSYLSFKQIH